MSAKHVFGKVELTREEREANRRIWEATKDEPSSEELDRRLGPGVPVDDPDAEFSRSALAHKIGVAREKAGLTQAELAEKVGADQATISRIERGEPNVTFETLTKLARALGLKLTLEPAEKD
jgi:ribosome-binding protein aMBF1 (putative translation factor)